MDSNTIRFSITLTKEQYEYVMGIADGLGISASDCIKILISYVMNENRGKPDIIKYSVNSNSLGSSKDKNGKKKLLTE
jgi:antitoxin component of RelBE/YafQ-DinJ toxin-antitoxin module